MEPVQEEQQYLGLVLGKIDGMLRQLLTQVGDDSREGRDLDEAQTAEEVAEEVVASLRSEQTANLQAAQREPYFGRLDFQSSADDTPSKLYIGKRGVEDVVDGERLVIDWRAPVASLFYSFSGQETAVYESQGEIFEGSVHLKRNIAIRDSKLQRVVDSYVQGQDNLNVADEFLLYRLEENKDNRLRDIVSTIQAEQDKIIRAARNQAIFIQGVAGSGKTTVALHRLAYLLYQYSEQMKSERMVIFAPNAMFMDYISDVLPELGVGGVQQTTFVNWALEQLDYSVELRDPEQRYERWFAQHDDTVDNETFAVVKRKGTLEFLEQIRDAVRNLSESLLPQEDFTPWDGLVLPASQMARWFHEDYQHYPLAKRRERVLARVKRWYESEYKRRREDDKSGAVKRQAASRFRAFKNRWTEPTPLSLYQQLLAGILPESGELEGRNITVGKSRRFRPLVDVEDLAPLLYLYTKLYGVDGRESFHHVVIDEAQDFSPVQLAVLTEFCPSQSFTVLGDLAQSIHTYQGVTNWGVFRNLFAKEHQHLFELNVSYRSTMEIIEFANHILAPFDGFTKAEPVFRSGERVRVHSVDESHLASHILSSLQGWQSSSATVAVVGANAEQCTQLHQLLAKRGLDARLITAQDKEYSGGVSIIPVYLTKGLEFDAVIIVDVDEEHYKYTSFDARLLYVGCTRALHHLEIIYSNAPSPLLGEAYLS